MEKILIIRFSSFGDIAQALSASTALKAKNEKITIHWLTRIDFSEFIARHPSIDMCRSLDPKKGISELFRLATQLRRENYTHIYDAHSNLRSHIITFLLRFDRWNIRFARRSKHRLKRLLLFIFKINLFPQPFKSIISYLTPIRHWGIVLTPPTGLYFSQTVSDSDFSEYKDSVLLAPSATWELKRWPTEYWKELILLNPHTKFVIVGGPKDKFCQEIYQASPTQVVNLSGKLSWLESVLLVQNTKAVVSGDTGIMHVADFVAKPCISIIGPTAFGFPSRDTSIVVETTLGCRPCTKDGRGRCTNKVYKKCLVDLKPKDVSKELAKIV